MVRVRQCCCGCSLRTGTLILLWLSVIGGISPIVRGLVAVFSSSGEEQSLLVHFQLPWAIVCMAITVCALVGVETRRPSFILPYIIISVVGLIASSIGTFVLFIGSITLRDMIIDYVVHSVETMQHHPDRAELYRKFDASFSIFIYICIFILTLSAYFTIVVYSYYKELQEKLSGVWTDRMMYAAPPDLQKKETAYNDYPPAYEGSTVPYSEQNPLYPPQYPVYPQQNPVYPQPNQLYPQLHGQKQ